MSSPPSEKDESWTILKLIRWTTDDFSKHSIDSPRLDAELLLSSLLGCERVDLYLRHGEILNREKLAAFREFVRRRRAREPVACITGKKAFRKIDLKVTPEVMTPRPETELLVDAVISCIEKSAKDHGHLLRRILDLGTGSGAIALSLAAEFPELDIRASDISEGALKIARENAKLLGLEGKIHFVRGDMFQPFSGETPFDLIVSNPPYIPTGAIPSLMPEVSQFEPKEALDGGPDGLEPIRKILKQAPTHLSPGGWLWLEVGDGQAQQVIEAAKPPLIHKETVKDYSGIPRVAGFSKDRTA